MEYSAHITVQHIADYKNPLIGCHIEHIEIPHLAKHVQDKLFMLYYITLNLHIIMLQEKKEVFVNY
jgi:hypothetical protein